MRHLPCKTVCRTTVCCFIFLSIVFLLGSTMASAQDATAAKPESKESKQNQLYSLYAFEKTLAEPIKTDPAQAAAQQQAWVAALKEPRREVIAVSALHASDWLSKSGNEKAAYELLQKSFTQLAGRPEGWWVLAAQIGFLDRQKKPAEAEALTLKYWSESLRKGASDIVQAYVGMLENNGKHEQARLALRDAFLNGPLLLESDHGRNAGWIYDLMTGSLHRDGKDDEAISWAKLRFIEATFDDAAIKSSTDALTKTLLTKDLAGVMVQGFLAAQKDSSQPNPLRDVPLPFTAEEITAALKNTPERANDLEKAHARLNLLLAGGLHREAMAFARRVLIDNIGNPAGAAEICRVFKAIDLNLKRGNEFIAYLQKGEGENPVTEYFKQEEAKAE